VNGCDSKTCYGPTPGTVDAECRCGFSALREHAAYWRRAQQDVLTDLRLVQANWDAEAEAARRARTLIAQAAEAMEAQERKLKEVWGKEENPYAVAYGWSEPLRTATLTALRAYLDGGRDG
jgi:hypothetical protein